MEFQIPSNYYLATERQMAEWLYSQKNKNYVGNLIYVTSFEKLNYPAVEKSFRHLLKRHESLRTSFRFINDTLYQIIGVANDPKFKIHYINMQDNQEEKLIRVEDSFASTKLDVENGPLFKLFIIKFAGNSHTIGLVIDHMIGDDRSMDILKSEFLHAYGSFLAGVEINLVPLTFQMKDYAIWETQFNASKKGLNNLHYWQNQFSDLEEIEPLFTTSFASDSFKGENEGFLHQFFIGTDTLVEVKNKYKNQYLFFMAMIIKWLSDLSVRNVVLLALPFTSRNTPELQNVVGYLISGLYIKVLLKNWDNIDQVLAEVTKSYAEALNHVYFSNQRLPVNPDKFCIAYLNSAIYVDNHFKFDGNLTVHSAVSKVPYYPINITLDSYSNGWRVTFHYNKAFFGGANIIKSIDRLYNEFITIARTS